MVSSPASFFSMDECATNDLYPDQDKQRDANAMMRVGETPACANCEKACCKDYDGK